MFLCRDIIGSSLAEIGNRLGNRHHSTVMHSIDYIENKIKDNFKRLPIYKDLENLGRPIKVVNCSIDRVTAYDKFVKCTVMLEIGGFEFDLIFKSEFNRRLRPLLGCYVQEISDQFYAKTLLGRPKDYRDLINFVPYDRDITYNDTKMIDIL